MSCPILRPLAEMRRVTRPGGLVAAYRCDHAGGMQPIRQFWTPPWARDPAAGGLDEAVRFPVARPEALRELFTEAILTG